MLKILTVAVVQGVAFGGGFELALACDFLVVAENATFCCVEVTTAMLPIAGALQRIEERAGRARASRFAMLGEPISGTEAGALGIATQVVPEDQLGPSALFGLSCPRGWERGSFPQNTRRPNMNRRRQGRWH
jgi:enoyl-CoA hydratase/carnithine racemase